jgi:hypothetical protein
MDIATAIKGIHGVRARIHEQDMWGDPVALSDAMTKLSVYNNYLADHLAPLHKEATDKSYSVFTEAVSSGARVTQAEQLARGESTEIREMYENCLNIYRATDNLISVLQSRVRVSENQLKREGLQT